ncbi:MAG: hypothetical protein L6R37_000197 [Teloschistes peruensis]|nr:MAG: hypothetical protein L6R37_000197 [Teloschistes peruensis]
MSIPSESQSDGDGQKQTGNPASFAFHNLNVYGYISSENVQKTFFSYASSVLAQLVGKFLGSTQESETLIGDTYGLYVDPIASLSYKGVPMLDVRKRSRGEYIYVPESDIHFPHLTVAQTLMFASQARLSSKAKFRHDCLSVATESMENTVKALGLSLRTSAEDHQTIAIATLYQASEDTYNCFDKVILFYEGREVFFGSTDAAKVYFTRLGFVCPDRSTTADFLCSITNPLERVVQEEGEDKAPRTVTDFAERWGHSPEKAKLVADIQSYEQRVVSDQMGPRHLQSSPQRSQTPYKATFSKQVRLCLTRGMQRLSQDLAPPISGIIGNVIISTILGSMFYNLPDDTSSFFGRGVLLFFTILTNTLLASFEGVQLWDHRPIVEKQHGLAFYHRSAEAVTSMRGRSSKATSFNDKEAQHSRMAHPGPSQDNLIHEIKKSTSWQRLLDDIEGWVEPGTVTALMGESGAGKTTLLNVLASRTSIGVVSGEKLVDAKFQNEGFARKIGYAQQHGIAMPTATVKETLVFYARLRQSSEYTDEEKLAYVEEVIATLDLSELADAVVGVSGGRLNIEQRKRLTIEIELAARPELLLFLDEPNSGLDSNTAWSICALLRKLADAGQTILCTIHQPSGTAFEIPTDVNVKQDWAQIWATSAERREVKEALVERKATLRATTNSESQTISNTQHASSYFQQLYHVTRRNFERDGRTPAYLHSKLFLALGASIFNGFSFYMSSNSLQGVQNQIFSVFLLITLQSSLVQLIIPRFLENRSLYELAEGPSRTYSWDILVISNVISEIPSQTVLAVIQFVDWYYPLGMYRNAISTHAFNERGAPMFLLKWSYMLFSSTFSQMVATIMPNAATGINISSLLYSLSLIFCG